jgi:hypothetical protein
VAAEIAQVGNPDAHLADAPGPAMVKVGVQQVEEPLLSLQGRQFGGDPGVAGQTPEIF